MWMWVCGGVCMCVGVLLLCVVVVLRVCVVVVCTCDHTHMYLHANTLKRTYCCSCHTLKTPLGSTHRIHYSHSTGHLHLIILGQCLHAAEPCMRMCSYACKPPVCM